MARRVRPVLVTGGAGFIGVNLADRLAEMGHDVLVLDSLARPGVERNLAWLRRKHPRSVAAITADIRDAESTTRAAADAAAVFHLAAQVAVTTSLADPLEDFSVNFQATLLLLEALRRHNPSAPLIFASTNKVYGDLADIALERVGESWLPRDPAIRAQGIAEHRPLDFHTPYGCSKGAADQYVLDWSRSFAVPTVVLRMSCIYGRHQMGTEDQGWVAHFLRQALHGEPIRIYGDGCQVRDVLEVNDAVAAYLAAWQRIAAVQGRAFNLGGGPHNAISLRLLLRTMEELLGHKVDHDFAEWRAGDQRWFVCDRRAATRALDLPPPLSWRDGVARLARWLDEDRAARPALAGFAGATP